MTKNLTEKKSYNYLDYDATQQQVASALGTSRESISVIERSALEKLKKILYTKHDIKSLDDLL
jgi:transcriptional regulator